MVLFFLTVPLILVLGLRGGDVGIDTAQYFYNYDKVLIDEYNKSPLFYLLSTITQFFKLNANSVFILFSILTISPLFHIIHKEKSSALFAVLVLFSMGLYLRYFNIMIQGAAVGFFFISFYYRLNGHNYRSAALFAFACFTHFSAFLLLPFLFINKLKNVKFIVLGFWVVSLAFIFSPYLLSMLTASLSFLIPNSYKVYVSGGFIKADNVFSLGNIIPQFLFLLVWFCYIKSKGGFSSYLLMFLLGIVIMNLLNSALFFNRIQLYFLTFGILAIPYSLNFFFSGNQRYLVNSMFVLFFSILFFYRLLQDPYSIVPYSFYWD